MAAVALFSMSSYAQTTTEAEGTTTTTEELTPVEMWAKVSATNPLHYFDRVTVVDEDENVAYADDGTKQIEPVPFKTETGGTALPQNASYFYVAEGSSTSFFALNKTLSKKEGKFVNSAGEVVDVPEDGAPTEGALGSGAYMDEDGNLVYPSDLVDEVSWNWEEMSSDYYLFTASNRSRFAYYNKAAKRFKTTTTETATKAKLYKVVTVYAPYFKDPEGPQKLENEDDTYKAEIINPNEGGELKYRFEGEDDTKWKTYPDGGIECETGEETTIETKIEFEGGSTPVVGRTFVPVYVPAPEITAELEEDGTLKIGVDGTAPVTITSEEGTSLTYSVGTGKAKEIESNEVEVDLAYIADQTPNTTPVTGMAIKEVEYTPWPTAKNKDNKATGTVKSDPTTENFTVVPNATAEDLELELNANPTSGSKVNGKQLVALWWTMGNAEYDYYTLAPNEEVASKDLLLTFDGIAEPVPAETEINDDGKVYFAVPSGEEYLNSHFTVAVPEGFYTATSGTNVVPTPAATVEYTTGLGNEDFVIDPETTLQPTDKNTIVVKVYPRGHKDAEVDFANPVEGESNYDAKFTGAESEEVTEITKVEKIAADEEGNPLPNTFEITFENGGGQAEFIKYYLENYDGMLDFAGYNVGFPAGTFKSGLYINEEKLNHHVKFIESVDLQIKPLDRIVCEGDGGMYYHIIATGKVFGESYNTPWDSNEESQIDFDENAEVTITGTNIFGDEVNVIGKIQVADVDHQKSQGIKEVYLVKYGTYDETLEEDPLRDFGFMLRADDGQEYNVNIPAGTFTANTLSQNEEFNGKGNVMAHPNWAATALPYTYDEGKQETSTLTLEITATLDNPVKGFERDVTVRNEDAVITVGGVPVESWEFIAPGEPYETDFVSKESYKHAGRLGEWRNTELTGEQVLEEKFGVVLHLASPITDVSDYTVVVPRGAFECNMCLNKELTVVAKPKVTYAIQEIKYIIPTTQKSVTYEIWGILPDGSKVDAPIDYIGETDPDAQNILNALRYNSAHYLDYDETGSGEKLTDSAPAFYPDPLKTAPVYNADKKTTTFTITFTDKLVKGYYKMNFPAGTVQAQGYNESDARLYQPFDVVPAYVYDATSIEEDYNDPSKDPKKKEYNIPTSTEEIPMYITAFMPEGGKLTGNANADVLLLKDTPVTIEGVDGTDFEETEIVYVNETDGIFTVTLPEGGLAEGRYSLTIPALSVTTNSIFGLVGDLLDEISDETRNLLFNPEPLVLYINVEDFAGPDDQPIEITTKQFAFEVPIDGLTEVLEPAASFDNGTPATLSTEEEGVLIVTIGEDKAMVKGVEHNFLHSGDYVLTIPAGAFKGQYATSYEDIDVDVKVVFEFVDFGCEAAEAPKYKDLTTSTEAEVVAEVGEHEKMYFTRNFGSTNSQGLALPFELTQDEVADYFSLWKIQAVTVTDESKFKLNWIPAATAYANKPYIMVPAKAQGLVSIALGSEDEPKEVKTPAVADDVWAATTMVKFDFFNTKEPMEFAEDVLTMGVSPKGEVGIGKTKVCNPWRWYLTSSDKGIEYVKIAINGVDIDATGIDFVEAAEGDNLIFNVAGQKLNTAAKGKVNIINGKKVFVK